MDGAYIRLLVNQNYCQTMAVYFSRLLDQGGDSDPIDLVLNRDKPIYT